MVEFHVSTFWFCTRTFQLHAMLYKLWDTAVICVMTPCSLVGWHNKCHTRNITTLNFYETSNLTLLDCVSFTFCCVSFTFCCVSLTFCCQFDILFFVSLIFCCHVGLPLVVSVWDIVFVPVSCLLLYRYLLLQNFHAILKETKDKVI